MIATITIVSISVNPLEDRMNRNVNMAFPSFRSRLCNPCASSKPNLEALTGNHGTRLGTFGVFGANLFDGTGMHPASGGRRQRASQKTPGDGVIAPHRSVLFRLAAYETLVCRGLTGRLFLLSEKPGVSTIRWCVLPRRLDFSRS